MRIVAVAALFVAGCSFGGGHVDTETKRDPCQELGAWSTWPEADWVREIVKKGGYEVAGDTGSAIVVMGKGHEFNIWAAEIRHPSPGMPNWRRMATVRGVPILGDRNGWRSWHAQGFTFWVHGGSLTPAAGRLAPIVDASLRIPFRDPCRA